MTNKINLTFGHLIAHFIPGLIFFISILAVILDTKELMKHIKDYTAIIISVGFFLSLACGLTLDALRYVIFLVPKLIKPYRTWSAYDITKADDDDRKFYNWIIENHYRFHQFYGNLCLSIVVSAAAIHTKTTLTICQLWPLYLASLLLAIAAWFTYARTINILTDKFPISQG